MATCDVSLTIEVFALPAGRALFSHASPHRGPSCAEALAAAVEGLADELLVKLESYRRSGPASAEPEIHVELVPATDPEGQRAVAEQLRRVIGVRRVRPLPDGGLVLTVYRELRAELACAIDALPDLAVATRRRRADSAHRRRRFDRRVARGFPLRHRRRRAST